MARRGDVPRNVGAAGRRGLLRVLLAPEEVRAELIGKLYAEDEEGGEPLAELLIELEEKEWGRQWFVERLGFMNTHRPDSR